MRTKRIVLEKALNAKRESKYVEFKAEFDVDKDHDWCEIIKDIAAMANSGGGIILLGVNNKGEPSGWNPTPLLNYDAARITDRIAKYTSEQFAELEIHELERNGHTVAALLVHGARIPMIFTRPGTYTIGGGRQKTAFGKGTIYFRHGPKSEPGDSKDLRECLDREIERLRRSWISDIRKVVNAPAGHRVTVLPPEVVESINSGATLIRIVDDPSAPAYRKIDPDHTHPHRQKEVVQLVNERLGGEKHITTFDILCVRKVYKIDQSKPNFYYKSKFMSPQYSDSFVKWLIGQFEKDALFFAGAREECKRRDQAP